MTTYRRKYDRRLAPPPSPLPKTVATVKKDVTAIKRLVFNEQKFYDQAGTAIINNGGGNFVACNNLSQGDDASTRTGNGVGNKSITIRVNGVWNVLSANPMHNLRVMLVKDKQPNGAFPSAATFLQNVSFQSGVKDSSLARFKILYDKTMAISQYGPGGMNFKISKRLKDFTKYSGNAGTIADIQTNAYWLYLISDQAANGPSVQYNVRYKFSDM